MTKIERRESFLMMRRKQLYELEVCAAALHVDCDEQVEVNANVRGNGECLLVEGPATGRAE